MIRFVITGLEHSGTTLISDLFRQLPGVDAGFEVGVLLDDTPRALPACPTFAGIVQWGWGVDRAALEQCCDTDDFITFYTRLAAAATVLKPSTTSIFDKTPRYLTELDRCMARLDVPFIVAFKDPRASVYSDWRRAGSPDFLPWFYGYARAKRTYAASMYVQYCRVRDSGDSRVCLVRMEDLCADPARVFARMAAHVGLTFDAASIERVPSRYVDTRPGAISSDIAWEYRQHFDTARCAYIARVFKDFHDWFMPD